MLSTRKIFENHEGNLLHKWDHYFEIYDFHFKDYINKEIVILEIGVSQGGSIELWKKFFGSNLKYFGIDINPKCLELEQENVKIFIGSQEDKSFLKDVVDKIPDLDILIDDGGHSMKQQITSFEILFSKIKNGGIYLCEDNHTSYWYNYGGGLKRSGTYIEYIKNLIDVMHLWYAGKNTYIKNHALKFEISSIHIYDSIVVIKKQRKTKPFDSQRGTCTVGYLESKKLPIHKKIGHLLFNIKTRLTSKIYK